ncbi:MULTISPECIES: hypothetical protein [Klebsiella pneumoniae complex]|uniref:hypothetical protein n=1 Tax=Klebsiella pneumoniae complex TaxID=3390273 RepID=UPI002875DAF6|nr:hypothetical protein [Klebsiella variicola]MDS0532496.1 hypothetical protein [Klebsiella quasipneumoniae]HBV7913887.1 hypothetical protein [Klebsiella variicola]HCM5246550.1 hypothetical protein [Klebsiella variicola subsp. variicola]
MINKRGLSPDEFNELGDELFQYLRVFDAIIEPSGAKFEMLKHAHSCYTMTMNNPNMTKAYADKVKVLDYDFSGILDGLTNKERVEKQKQENVAHTKSYFAEQKERIAKKERNNNGKK